MRLFSGNSRWRKESQLDKNNIFGNFYYKRNFFVSIVDVNFSHPLSWFQIDFLDVWDHRRELETMSYDLDFTIPNVFREFSWKFDTARED